MASNNIVDILLRLKGARQFATESKQASDAIKKTGDEAEKTGKKMHASRGGAVAMGAGLSGLAAGAALLKSSASETLTFHKAVAGLVRVTGMENETASAWVEIAKTRDISTQKLGMGFKKLDTAIVGASAGGKSQIALFDKLGVSMADVNAGRTDKVVMQVAEGMTHLSSAAEKTDAMTKLFGRSSIALMPLLSKGGAGLAAYVKEYQSIGPTVKNGANDILAAAEKQRELTAMWDRTKETIGTKLIPALVTLATGFQNFVGIFDPIVGKGNGLIFVLGGLAAGFAAMSIIGTISTLMGIFAGVTIAGLSGIALALVATGIGVLIIGIGIALYYVTTHFKQVKAWAMIVWGWIKQNWPMLLTVLLGPFGFAAQWIIRHFGEIKHAALSAVHWITNAFNDFIGFFSALPGQIAAIGSGLWNGLLDSFISVANEIIKVWNATGGQIPGMHINLVSFGKKAGPGGIPPKKLAAGGIVTGAGSALVGESGPELLSLPSGARVNPLPPRSLEATVNPAQTIITKVFLDRRQIAEAVGIASADKLARA